MSPIADEHLSPKNGLVLWLPISVPRRQVRVRPPHVRLLVAAVVLMLFPTGCVHRRFTINSNPSGALVRIDGKDVGYTPASIDYTWYGTREVQLIKDGYETQTQLVNVKAPWYQHFPLDFLSENFLGTHVRDHRRFDIPMRPKQPDLSQEVIERGRSLRSQAVHGM
ncbi:MAG: PEGA domain-containing protein [Fuerstiella sp.]|nr:PEGA domain-containing protein [Fuerstiella sp.]